MLRGAFIGFGNVAAKGHLPGWQSRTDVRIVAATDVLSTRRDAFLKACPNGRWYESVDDLLSGETLDFVDICTPPAVAVAPEGSTNWRVDPAIAGGGILLDHGWHALYCIVRWAGAPRGIAAVLEKRRFHESPLEDTATVT